MITKSDNLFEIILWLTDRMSDTQMDRMFEDLRVTTVEQLKLAWHRKEVKERVKREVTKRATAADCRFTLGS